MRLVLVLIASVLTSAAYADDCMKSDPSGNFESCTGSVASIELFENRLAGGGALAWVILTDQKCTSSIQTLFVLGNDEDKTTFTSKVAIAQQAMMTSGAKLTIVYRVKDAGPYKHVVRVNFPSLAICSGASKAPTRAIGANEPLRLVAP